METLRGYSIGSNLQRLLQRYWEEHAVVPKDANYFGEPFGTDRGVKQGDPVSLAIFNTVVDAVVRAVLLEVCGTQESHHWLVWAAGEHNIIFYA